MPVERQILSIYAGTRGFLDEFPVETVGHYEKEMLAFLENRYPDLFREIASQKVISPELDKRIEQALKEFAVDFRKTLKS